jgi:uncharacterized lipoprotein NlpE involved in copper resistance
MKKIIFAILIIIGFSLLGCSNNNNNLSDLDKTNETENSKNTGEMDSEESVFVMKIDNIVVNITWEKNDSVNELMEYAKNGITITMHQYGGFEQVGSIGKTITSNDSQITTNPGDVVLYSSNQIVIFFGTNSWSYTKLGHINMNQSELNSLLNKSNVTLKLGEE